MRKLWQTSAFELVAVAFAASAQEPLGLSKCCAAKRPHPARNRLRGRHRLHRQAV
jgi:hypothetical protein